MSTDVFLSVGIDIGTTTTHLTASKLELGNTSTYRQAPRLKIARKEIVYSGPVHLTPLLDDGTIDAGGVAEIVRNDYLAAGLEPQKIRAGAVIVTGETAKRRNAQQVAQALADLAGDFVVAGAGANMESVLAARGAGAFAASRMSGRTILNADIGGGTVNVAVIQSGESADTYTLAIGGRFMQLDATARVTHITEPGKSLLATRGIEVHPGETLDVSFLWQLGEMAAECIFDFLTKTGAAPDSLIVTGATHAVGKIDDYWISGGVAELMRADSDDESLETLIPYGDMGVFVATSLKRRFECAGVEFVVANSAIRATVIGAGMHALQLSGSTIETSDTALPIRNLPLVRLSVNTELDSAEQMIARMKSQLAQHDLDWTKRAIGVYLQLNGELGYQRLKKLSMELAQMFKMLSASQPYITIVEHDVAAALGMLLRQQLEGCQLIVIDGIEPEDGDYIDIGNPLVHSQLGSSATALPVVIKSLIFSQ
ncbi:MAG TPA: ethanolamine ammonia-lyase reactivating factor EutA [Planktothrix sp.]